MRLPQRPDQQDTDRRIERALLQELRVRRASPMPDARDAYDDLKGRIVQVLADEVDHKLKQQDAATSRASIQAQLDALLAEEKIILKQHEKRRLSQDVINELLAQQTSTTMERASTPFLTIQELCKLNMLSGEAADFLQAAVLARANIIISGQGKTGKTTLLRALCGFISADEQIVTIEDRAELHLDHKHVLSLETQAVDNPHKPQIPAETLLMTCARMRPDRLILGSVGGSETYAWLQLINGDLRGSMTTCLAENPQESLAWIEAQVLAVDPPSSIQQVRSQIESAVDLVVHLEEKSDHSLQVVSISEISGFENDQFVTVDAI